MGSWGAGAHVLGHSAEHEFQSDSGAGFIDRAVGIVVESRSCSAAVESEFQTVQ